MSNAIIRHDEDLRIVRFNLLSMLEEVRNAGINIGNNNRFHKFIHLIDQYYTEVLLRGETFSRDTLLELLEGYKDYQQLSIITKSRTVMDKGRSSLSKIFAGNSLPSLDTNSQARDFQFELYMAAMLDLKGFSVRLDEPDIIFTYKEKKYGIAAKRVKSSGKIEDNLKKGDYQIAKAVSNGSVRDGFIAISLGRFKWKLIRARR